MIKYAFSIYEGLDITFSPFTIIMAFIIIVVYSFFISGLCILIASTCKTFKETQSALTPLTFISLFPGMIALMIISTFIYIAIVLGYIIKQYKSEKVLFSK